jgi:hypothetical protein
MYMTIPLLDLIGALTICVASIILVIDGWRMYFNKTEILFLPMKIGFFLAKLFFGKEEANKRKDRLLTPTKVKQNGKYTLIGGASLFIAGLFLLLETINRIIIIP